MNITVIGGGLAGLSAALVLAESGMNVRLLERSQRLGGRASSIHDNNLDIDIDRGQHALLGCCTNLLDFYRRIDALDCISFYDSISFIDERGPALLHDSRFPEPFHLMPSLLLSNHLSRRDKANAAKLLLRSAHRFGVDIPASLWLSRLGQSDSALSGFWEPILTAALNENLDNASAKHASQVIRLAMLTKGKGFRMGVPQVSLSEIHNVRAKLALERAGVSVGGGELVLGIEPVDGEGFDIRSFRVASRTEEIRRADRVIVATNPNSRDLIQRNTLLSVKGLPAMSKPVQVPIITLYMWFSEKMGIAPITCMPIGHFQWCFDRTKISPLLPGMGTSVSLVCSAARGISDKTDMDIVKLGMDELRSVVGDGCPDAKHTLVIRSKAATFSPFVGCDDIRPINRTLHSNLYIAGEWTATGWPGTMESAVRSGYSCAAEILSESGLECTVPLPNVEKQGLAKLLF